MGINVDGQVKRLTPEDGEVSVKAGSIHNFFIHPDSKESMTVYLSASDSGMDYQLDRIFFENWYGYWHDALLHGGGLDWIQFLAVCISPFTHAIRPSLTPSKKDPRRRRCIHTRPCLGPLSTSSRLLVLRHHRALDRRTTRLQALFQGIHDRLGLCRGQDEGFLLPATSGTRCVGVREVLGRTSRFGGQVDSREC